MGGFTQNNTYLLLLRVPMAICYLNIVY